MSVRFVVSSLRVEFPEKLPKTTPTSIQLSITNPNPSTPPTASHKRNRPSSSQSTVIDPNTQPHLCIQFNTPLQSTPMEILTELATALDNASIPQDSISSTLFSWASPSVKISDKKLSFIDHVDGYVQQGFLVGVDRKSLRTTRQTWHAIPVWWDTGDRLLRRALHVKIRAQR